MLPSFRLIAATFLCGFVVVFAGLRLAVTLNGTHAPFPVMAAHAAPVPVTPIADSDVRRGQSTVPVMYDPRFVISTASLSPVRASLVVPPAAPPLDITPPAVGKVTTGELPPLPGTAAPEKPSTTVAAISPQAAPAQAATGPAAAEPLKPQGPAVAAIDPRPSPEPAATPSFDIPMIEPAAVDLSPSATDRARTAATETNGALSDPPASDAAPAQPTAAIPMPEPKAAAPRARAKVIRKPRARVARRAASDDPFAGLGNPDLFDRNK